MTLNQRVGGSKPSRRTAQAVFSNADCTPDCTQRPQSERIGHQTKAPGRGCGRNLTHHDGRAAEAPETAAPRKRIPATTVRAVAFILIALWIFGAPFYRQVLGDPEFGYPAADRMQGYSPPG